MRAAPWLGGGGWGLRMQGAPGGPSDQADGRHCCLRRDIGKRLEVRKTVSACLGEPSHIMRLEHAQARLTLSYNRRGDLAIHLVSPMGTRSTLLAARCLPCPLSSPSPWPRAFIHPLTQPEGQQTLRGDTQHFGKDDFVLWEPQIAGIPDSTHQVPHLCAFPCAVPLRISRIFWLRTSGLLGIRAKRHFQPSVGLVLH